jgi:hypothetical protein
MEHRFTLFRGLESLRIVIEDDRPQHEVVGDLARYLLDDVNLTATGPNDDDAHEKSLREAVAQATGWLSAAQAELEEFNTRRAVRDGTVPDQG